MSLSDMSADPVQDEIIAEVRAIREALAAQFGYDLDRLFEEAKRRERYNREQIPPSPKRLTVVMKEPDRSF